MPLFVAAVWVLGLQWDAPVFGRTVLVHAFYKRSNDPRLRAGKGYCRGPRVGAPCAWHRYTTLRRKPSR